MLKQLCGSQSHKTLLSEYGDPLCLANYGLLKRIIVVSELFCFLSTIRIHDCFITAFPKAHALLTLSMIDTLINQNIRY